MFVFPPHWCVICKDGSECLNHFILQCSVALSMWKGFFGSLSIVETNQWLIFPCCVKDTTSEKTKRHRCWVIWMERNKRLFGI